MRAYMVWAGQSEDGASLVIAGTAREAKRLAWWGVPAWLDYGDYTAMRVKWMRDADVPYLLAKYGEGFTECPQACESCELWYPYELARGLFCESCEEQHEPPTEDEVVTESVTPRLISL